MTQMPQAEIFRPLTMREGRVLVIDDEAAIRMPIRRCLLQAGLEVVEAADGEAAGGAVLVFERAARPAMGADSRQRLGGGHGRWRRAPHSSRMLGWAKPCRVAFAWASFS